MLYRPRVLRLALATASLVATASTGGCGDDPTTPARTVAFDHDGTLAGATFWDLPFPSDLRLTEDGKVDMAGFPNPRELPLLDDLIRSASNRAGPGAPMMPVAYFRFTEAPTAVRSLDDVITADPGSDVLILDIDPDSPDRGTLYPAVTTAVAPDGVAVATLVAVAPRPGIVLAPHTTYAIALARGYDAASVPPTGFAALAAGEVPAGARGADAATVFAPLWQTLPMVGLEPDDLLVATVLTTGDEAAVLRARSEAVRAAHDATITGVQVDADDGAAHEGYCELRATVAVPAFQRGEAPYDTKGDFVYDDQGMPIAQDAFEASLTLTLPHGEMPPGGWPLYLFFHGSGGSAASLVDAGPTAEVDGEPAVGQGPGYVVARHGIAGAAASLPMSPDRLPGASDYEYLNISNLGAFPFTFQQGVFEQRLLIDALLELEIEPAVLATCPEVTLPGGEVVHHFDSEGLVAGGQSMGGLYTNMIGAVEDRLGALVPTGAGGFWNLMIIDTNAIDGAAAVIGTVFAVDPDELTFVYPGLGLLGLGWEIADPVVSMPRLGRRPLPGLQPHDVYQPIGLDDEFFPMTVFDAAALANGHQQAGEQVWPGTQAALALDGLGGIIDYPVSGNLDGGRTGVVVQYAADGIVNSHYLYRQSEAVKHQYGCFLRSYLDDGVGTVVAPGALSDPCE